MNCVTYRNTLRLRDGLRSAALLCLALAACRAQAEDQVLASITNFTQTGPIVVSHWPASLRAITNANLYSSRENVLDAETGRQVYRLTMAADFPWQWTNTSGSIQQADAVSVFAMPGWDYLPPETDELRIRVKVVSGRFQLAMGCINLAFAPSDTYTDIRVLDESSDGWQTLRFSLHKHLVRNYRRNDFTKALPYINITRWIQEPLQLYLFRSGDGELLVDQVELVSCGLGRAYPQPTPAQIVPVAIVADFETANDLASVFSFSTVPLDLSGPQPTNYSNSSLYTSGRIMVADKSIQWYLPPGRSWVDQSTNGAHSLEVKQRGYESFAFTGLRLPNPDGANALQLTLRAAHDSTLTDLVIDFLAYGAPPASKAAFPWTKCQPPAAWLADTNINFDLFLSESNTSEESYALYHARRTVPNGQWTRVLLPLEDFAGIYAINEGTNILKSFEPLRSTNLLFMGFFSPYRQLRAETRIWIDDVSLVHVGLLPEQLHSFWQNPAITNAQLIALPDYPNYYGHFRQRDQALGPLTLSLTRGSSGIAIPVSGPAGQRYDILASDELQQWQPVATGYVGSSEDTFHIPANKPSQFFKAVSE